MIVLRPHHGLCIRYFTGKGYSKDFVQNMSDLMGQLQPDTEIRLSVTKDYICRACPNMQGNQCTDNEKVLRYDEGVLEAIKEALSEEEFYESGEEKYYKLTYGRFQEFIETYIMETKRFDTICGDCSWGQICHK